MKPGPWVKRLEKLYGPHTVYGPYVYEDRQRRFMTLKLPSGRMICKQYAKFKMEAKLGRILTKDETVNHIDTDSLNDDIGNLEILTHSGNIKHAHSKGVFNANYELTRQRLRGNKRATGDKNPNSCFTDAQVISYREESRALSRIELKAFKENIAKQHGCGERPVRDMLSGRSYSHLDTSKTVN